MVPNETSRYCGKYYVVEEGDDCAVLLATSSITLDDFLFLNPQVWRNCTNLWLDYSYCIQAVGTITTDSGYGGTTTVGTSTVEWDETEMTRILNATKPSTIDDSRSYVIPLANGTRRDCEEYIWFANVTDNAAAGCWTLAWLYEISSQELVLWNPSLAKNATDDSSIAADSAITATASSTEVASTNVCAYDCTVAESSSYCVGLTSATDASDGEILETPSPRAGGEVANCTRWYQIENYDDCESLLLTVHMVIDEFYAMNPAVGATCTGMSLGTYYCISTYSGGVPYGMPEWASDTTSTTKPVTSTATQSVTTTSSASGITTPSPIQSGMTTSCKSFHKVVSGGGCWNLAQANGISLDAFYSWNPAVGTDCSDLELDVYVCIGVTAAATTTA
ncbi:hypothetical protein B0T10DRAFT_569316 [Thelonectria olida]|uniref:LysM domain-containing protein n=1 Tax=Thelonectria olida TaxID=1576542 RepID=A0A9P8VMW0_9HYPO|nr:hypothetical protein B0T10DRAFT_569316 [Thelonectria olida]